MTGFWIWLVNVSQSFKSTSGLQYARAQNMARLWIWECNTGCWIGLNNSKNALIMPWYVWIFLNMIEYWHLQEKRVLKMPEFWMCLMQYIALDLCTNYWSVIEKETYSEPCQTFKMECFPKRIILECRCATRNSSMQGKGRFGGGRVLW